MSETIAGIKIPDSQMAKDHGIKAAHVFINERGQPFGRVGNAHMIDWAGEGIRGGFLGHASITNTVR
jgi:hypothetical protein